MNSVTLFKRLLFFLLLSVAPLPAQSLIDELKEVEIYADEELQEFWASLDNLLCPTLEDYERVHQYLRYGRREYLDVVINHANERGFVCRFAKEHENELYRSYIYCNRLLQRIELTNIDQNLKPQFEIIPIGCDESDLSRCILVYSTFNCVPLSRVSYHSQTQHLVKELKKVGFKGHLLLRKGGYPLERKGGLKLVHVPYSFKVLSFLEAEDLGYKSALWLDTSVHPLNNLNAVFRVIEKKGYYTLKNGIQLDYDNNFGCLPYETMVSWGVETHQLKEIDHIVSTIFGVRFQKPIGRALIKQWYHLFAELLPAMSLYPEEFLLSLSCWRLKLTPSDHIGHVMDVKSVKPYKPRRSGKPFWHDKS